MVQTLDRLGELAQDDVPAGQIVTPGKEHECGSRHGSYHRDDYDDFGRGESIRAAARWRMTPLTHRFPGRRNAP